MPVQEGSQWPNWPEQGAHAHTQTHTWTATVLTHDVQRPEGQENVITSAAGPGIPAWVVPLLQNKLFPTEGPALERQPPEGGRDRVTAGVAEQGPTSREKNRKERHSAPSRVQTLVPAVRGPAGTCLGLMPWAETYPRTS